MGKIINAIKKTERIMYLFRQGFLKWIPDAVCLKIIFKIRLGYQLNLKNPKTFNEKLQWLKLNDRKPEYTKLVDKLEVKRIVAEKNR